MSVASVSVREELEAPADRVWACLRDFGDLSAWAPKSKLLSMEGEGVGAVRRVDTSGSLFVERCIAHDDERRRFGYTVLRSPLPFRNYVAHVAVTELAPGRSAI